MSCNTCSPRPCSCPNVNCGCPPDYSFNPATLTCQGTTCESTLPTSCIFSSAYLSCVKLETNTDLQTILNAMDAKICQCGSCSGNTFQPLPLFYVDSNNTISGDGSVGNPFKTIELAYTAVIGSGTINSPENANATVYVMGGEYTTTQNIYIPTTNWTFFNGVNITFTGSGTYFIDSAAANDGAADFKVFGWINFQTTTGGFLRNSGSYVNLSQNKGIYVEAFKIVGSTTTGSQPLINHVMSYGGTGFARLFTTIKMQGMGAVIASAQQHCISYNGGSCYIDLGQGSMFYGVDLINGTVTGNSSGNLVRYNCTDTVHPQFSRFILKNGYVSSVDNTDMIYVAGKFAFIEFENLYGINLGLSYTQPDTFLNIATTNANAQTSLGEFDFLLKDIYLTPSCFSTGTVIVYTAGGNAFEYLNMQNCKLYHGCTIQFANITLGAVSMGGAVSGYNIINGRTNIYNLPTSSAGLSSGDLWSNSNIITII